MKIKDWSKKFLWFVLGAGTVGFLSFVSTSDAQQSQFVKLIMRFGEERVLEDGTKVGVSKGDGDLIVVAISKVASTRSSNISASSSGLKIGTYTIRAKQSWKSYGVDSEEWVTVKLRIESIDRNGEVKAHSTLGFAQGQLKGKVDENGVLELTGITGSESIGYSRFTIRATVEEDSLVNGTYLKAAGNYGSEVRGVFNSASWEK